MTNQALVREIGNNFPVVLAEEELTCSTSPIPKVDEGWTVNGYPNGWPHSLPMKPAIALLVVGFSGSVLAGPSDGYIQTANLADLQFANAYCGSYVTGETSDTVSNVVTASEMIDDVREYFGLNMAQAARIFNVSRATLYNHMRSIDAPVDHYQVIYRLTNDMKNRGFLKVSGKLKSVAVEGKTLLDILNERPLCPGRLESACEMLSELNLPNITKYGIDSIRSSVSDVFKGRV